MVILTPYLYIIHTFRGKGDIILGLYTTIYINPYNYYNYNEDIVVKVLTNLCASSCG
jgi:hypothetical protein